MNTFKDALNKMLSTESEQAKCVKWANERYKTNSGVSKHDMVKAYVNQLLGH